MPDGLSVMVLKRMCNSQKRLLRLPRGALVAASRDCINFRPIGACGASTIWIEAFF